MSLFKNFKLEIHVFNILIYNYFKINELFAIFVLKKWVLNYYLFQILKNYCSLFSNKNSNFKFYSMKYFVLLDYELMIIYLRYLFYYINTHVLNKLQF